MSGHTFRVSSDSSGFRSFLGLVKFSFGITLGLNSVSEAATPFKIGFLIVLTLCVFTCRPVTSASGRHVRLGTVSLISVYFNVLLI